MTIWERIRSTLEMRVLLPRILIQDCCQSGLEVHLARVVLGGGYAIRSQITAR